MKGTNSYLPSRQCYMNETRLLSRLTGILSCKVIQVTCLNNFSMLFLSLSKWILLFPPPEAFVNCSSTLLGGTLLWGRGLYLIWVLLSNRFGVLQVKSWSWRCSRYFFVGKTPVRIVEKNSIIHPSARWPSPKFLEKPKPESNLLIPRPERSSLRIKLPQ